MTQRIKNSLLNEKGIHMEVKHYSFLGLIVASKIMALE